MGAASSLQTAPTNPHPAVLTAGSAKGGKKGGGVGAGEGALRILSCFAGQNRLYSQPSFPHGLSGSSTDPVGPGLPIRAATSP